MNDTLPPLPRAALAARPAVPTEEISALVRKVRSTGFMTRDQCHEVLEQLAAKGIELMHAHDIGVKLAEAGKESSNG